MTWQALIDQLGLQIIPKPVVHDTALLACNSFKLYLHYCTNFVVIILLRSMLTCCVHVQWVLQLCIDALGCLVGALVGITAIASQFECSFLKRQIYLEVNCHLERYFFGFLLN